MENDNEDDDEDDVMTQPDLVSKLRERIADYLKGGGLFNPEMAEHDRVRELLIDCHVALQELESSPSPSTPIVPGTAGLSAEQVQRIVELHHNDGIFLWASMTADLNALFGAKPAEPGVPLIHGRAELDIHDARIRKDALEEAARLCESAKVRPDGSCAGHTILDCHSSDAYWIRACAERPAPAGEVRSGWEQGYDRAIREALEAALPQLEWANIHGSRCEELLRWVKDLLRLSPAGEAKGASE